MLKLVPDNAEISGDPRHVVGQGKKMSGELRSIDGAKEKISTAKTGQGLCFQKKNQIGHPSGKMCVDPKCVFRRNNEELVKHMSNVPRFLQRVEKVDTVQEKALNFGVLDWKKLETWKYNERMPKAHPKKKKPLSSNSLSSPCVPPMMSPNLRKRSSPQNAPRCLSPNRQPTSAPSTSHLNSLVKGGNGFFQPEKKCVEGIKSKEKEPWNRKSQSSQKSSSDNPRQNSKLLNKGFPPTYADSCGKNNLETNMLSKKVALSSEQGFNHNLSSSSQQKFKVTLPSEETCTAEVLAVPKHSREGSFSGSSQVTDSGTYLDEQLAEAIRNKLHDFFSPQELYSEEFISSTQHSCPLPSRATTNKKPVVNQRFGKDKNSCPAANYVKPMRSGGKNSTMHEKTAQDCENEQFSIPARSSEKGRYLSPSRLSFNLRKMSRSFSFKEISIIPQMKSTSVSGPVKPEVSCNVDNFGGKRDNKETTSSKRSSSPLRRLLDPFLKNKVAHSTSSGTPLPSKGPPNFMTFTKNPSKRQPQDKKKPGLSVYHALVQCTLKNGHCFFEFVVDDKSDMLAAAVKRPPATKKGDPFLIYTFYSIRRARKKSTNWMSQGTKGKSENLGYNIVAQMIMSTTSSDSDAVECILYGKATNEETPESESVVGKEIAAIVVRYLDKIETFNNTVLILPGGGHGVPVKGAPTTLISRWRSNGVCDCGGWDVGCKLRILTDCKSESNFGPSSNPKSTVSLFQQGEKQERGPLLSFEPLNNGYYSVAIDASVSFLEAFATCVANITCRQFPELVAATKLHNVNYQKVNEGGKIPGNYVTCPPLSPVGRI